MCSTYQFKRNLLLGFMLLVSTFTMQGVTCSQYGEKPSACAERIAEGKDIKKLNTGKIQEEIIKYITKNADLTAAESRDFFPLYFTMRDKLRNTERQKGRILRLALDKNMGEKDCQRAMNQIVQLEKKSSRIETEYMNRLCKIVGAKKYMKVMYAERKFNRRVFKQLMKHSNGKN